MKSIAKLGVLLCMATAFMYAETWTGKLVDYNCYERTHQAGQPTAKGAPAECAPTASTTVYGLELANGTVHKIDTAANSKIMAAMKSEPATRAAAGGQPENFMVIGTMEKDMIKLENIQFAAHP
jgi:hypothetical protein